MQRVQPPSNNLQQQYKRQASFGVGNHDNTIDSNNNNNINCSSSSSPHYYLNELQTVGMRIRQCVDQGYNLLNREKSDLSNASLNASDNVKNYAGLIVPQYNPTCVNSNDININNNNNNNNNNAYQQQLNSIDYHHNNNNSDYEDNNNDIDENEVIYLNGKRKHN